MYLLRNLARKLGQHQNIGPEAAQYILEGNLARYRTAISAVRSYHQHMLAGAPIDVTDMLVKYVEENSDDKLYCTSSNLFLIDLDTMRMLDFHEDKLLINPQEFNQIRGFRFLLYDNRVNFECFVVDGGKSKERFQGFGEEARRELLERFSVGRQRSSLIYLGDPKELPIYYGTFLLDEDNGYTIQTVMPFKSPDPWLFRRRK